MSSEIGSASSGTAIEVRDVAKKFRLFSDKKTNIKEFLARRRKTRSEDFWALNGVSFDIPRGQTFGLIGHNGSGKSTLLKLVAGIHRPTSGSIVSNGRISAMLELGAGFHPELSGRENIYLNGSILGMTRKQINASMDEIIDFSGLHEFIDTPVKVYSSGMYVRLAFAIAVNLDPEILIVDEVIAVGDEEFQRKCFDHLYKLRQKGVTIVLVSHSLGIVADLCDEVAWLNKGELMGVGPARELIDQYLATVNAAEAAAMQADATQPSGLEDGQGASTRIGSGEIRITGLTFHDESGGEVPFLHVNEPCILRLRYSAAERLPSVTFGLSFVHESGADLAGPNSGYGDSAFDVPNGTGHVDFSIARLPLQPGLFDVTVAAVDKGHTYDYRDRAFTLKVRAKEAVTEPGLIKLEGTWSASRTTRGSARTCGTMQLLTRRVLTGRA